MPPRKGPSMKPGAGRFKGGAYEALIASLFTKWWDRPGCRFMRTDALQTLHAKDRVVFGDVVPVLHGQHSYDLSFPFSVECKADESWDFLHLWKRSESSPFEVWWTQCSRDATSFGRIPALVFKKNFQPNFIAYPVSTERKLQEFINQDVFIHGVVTTLGDTGVYIVRLDDFFLRYRPMHRALTEVSV